MDVEQESYKLLTVANRYDTMHHRPGHQVRDKDRQRYYRKPGKMGFTSMISYTMFA